MTEELILIGEIVNTQGHRGAVRVLPLTDFPERYRRLKAVYLEQGSLRRQVHIERVSYHKRFVILEFREIPDMNAAEKLKGAQLKIHRSELVPLPDGHHYVFDIVGSSVFDAEGEYLGVVEDVLRTGANDVYVVKSGDGDSLLVPALKTVVRDIDLARRRITVVLPEGLRE